MAKSSIAAGLFVLVAALAARCAEDRGDMGAQAVEAFRKRVGRIPLRLALDDPTAAKRFFFVIEVFSNRTGVLKKSFDVLVQRDGETSSVLSRYPDGTPYCFFTDGLVVVFDVETATLRTGSRGKPKFSFESEGEHPDAVFMAQATVLAQPRTFVLDVDSFLGPTDRKAARFDATTLRLEIDGRYLRTTVDLTPDVNGERFPIERMQSQDRDGNLFSVGRFCVGKDAAARLSGVTAASLKTAGLNVVEMAEQAKPSSPFPPEPRAGLSPAERAGRAWLNFFAARP